MVGMQILFVFAILLQKQQIMYTQNDSNCLASSPFAVLITQTEPFSSYFMSFSGFVFACCCCSECCYQTQFEWRIGLCVRMQTPPHLAYTIRSFWATSQGKIIINSSGSKPNDNANPHTHTKYRTTHEHTKRPQ